MRTENSSTPELSAARIRDRLARVRRSVAARGLAVRWLAALAGLALLVGLAYLATIPSAGKYLNGGKPYPLDDIAKITDAFDREHIECRVEDRRITVSSEQYETAKEVVAKLNLVPRSIPDILKEDEGLNFLEPPNQRERRELRGREEILEAFIRKLEGIESVVVRINRTKGWAGVRRVSTATAFVWAETKDDRKIPPKTVEAITNIVIGNEPDLNPNAVSVCDATGRHYVGPANPELTESARTRAREEEMAEAILRQIQWIKGVQVMVRIVPAPAPAPPSVEARGAEPPAPAASLPRIGVNEPLEAEPEPKPAPPAPPVDVASVRRLAPKANQVKVWVRVPISFYYSEAMPNRKPSPEDMQPLLSKTEALIRTAVDLVVPADEAGTVKIDTIPDRVASRDPLVAPAVPDARRSLSWWIPAAGGGAGAATVLAIVFRLLATRKPRVARALETSRRRASAAATAPGPSERVRELIRRNPEAAASVLHRWIGQGGHAG